MNAERRGSVAYTDKERLQSLQEFLPESQVRDFVHQMQTSFPRHFADYATSYVAYRREIQDSAVFRFDKEAIQEAYESFNAASDDLYKLALARVLQLDEGQLDTSELYFPEGMETIGLPEGEEAIVATLGALADTYQETYAALLRAALENGKPAVSLVGMNVRYDDELPAIFFDTQRCDIPAYTNVHYLARTLFAHRIGESFDWSVVYDEIDATGAGGRGQRNTEQEARTVKDAAYRLNNRIREVVNTDDTFCNFEAKSVRRNY